MVKFCPKMSKGNSQSQNVSTGFVFACTNNSMTTIVYGGLGPLSTVFTVVMTRNRKNINENKNFNFNLIHFIFKPYFIAYNVEC